MKRAMSTLLTLTLAAAAAACGDTGPPDADVVIAPVELARELAADPAAAIASYDGQILELSGTVGSKIEPGGLNPTIGMGFASIGQQLAFDSNLSFVSFNSEDPESRADFDALAIGDPVTLRCRFDVMNEEASLFLVKDCRSVP